MRFFLRSTPIPQPLTPLDPNRGGPLGGPGNLKEGGDLTSLTPKCDIFLEIPCKDQTEYVGKVGNVGRKSRVNSKARKV